MFKYELVTYGYKFDLNTVDYPLYVYLEITDNCNFKCKFCSVGNKSHHFMKLELAKKIIDNLRNLNIYDIYYTGGEPLLHPDFDKIVKYANSQNMRQTVLTNGFLIDKKQNILKDCTSVCVSLHGNKEMYNKITGVNCYDKVIHNILLLKNVRISYTLTDDNLIEQDILSVCDFCKEHNLKLSFNKYNNIGDGKTNNCDVDLTKFIKVLENLRLKKYKFSINNCLPPCIVEVNYHHLSHGCGAGYIFASIDYNGNVKICPSAIESFGNIEKISFKKIWSCKKLKEFREFIWIPIQCRSCLDLYKCRCGCKVEAGRELLKFNDQKVITYNEYIWEFIKNKKFSVNISLIRVEGKNYINLSAPPRKFNKATYEVIKKLNDGLEPIHLEYAKDLILSLYRDKLLLECDKNAK